MNFKGYNTFMYRGFNIHNIKTGLCPVFIMISLSYNLGTLHIDVAIIQKSACTSNYVTCLSISQDCDFLPTIDELKNAATPGN